MRFIDLLKINPNDPKVVQWEKTAKSHWNTLKTLKTHDERREYFKQNPFWNEFKDILMDKFGKKCWYSECSIEGDFGDVDHFRPKNRSVDENGITILKDGYWWLAFDYHNYRLSCAKCNRPSKPCGKRDLFPIKKGTPYAVNPNSSDDNILLDPCKRDDCELIDCDNMGSIVAVSKDRYKKFRVEVSKRIYNLNIFNYGRKKVRKICMATIMNYGINFKNNNVNGMKLCMMTLKEIVDSKSPYSSFARKCIQNKIMCKPYEDEIQKMLQNVP